MRSLKGGLSHKTVLGLTAGAFALVACTAASEAASVRPQDTETLSASLQAFFTPKQFDTDGSVYGVRVRADASDLPDLQMDPRIGEPYDAVLTGGGEQVAVRAERHVPEDRKSVV